jgi:hypothetical protein
MMFFGAFTGGVGLGGVQKGSLDGWVRFLTAFLAKGV